MMRSLFASLLAVVAGTGLLWSSTDGFQAITAEGARRLEAERDPRFITPLVVETMSGKLREVPGSDGRTTLVEFIYTRCPTLCQSAGADMKRLGERIAAEGLADQVSLLSVSFEPDYDNVDRLAAYGHRHKADGTLWTISRPNHEALDSMLRDFGVIVIPDNFGGLTHNIAVHLVTPDGKLAGIFDPEDVDTIVLATRRILQQ